MPDKKSGANGGKEAGSTAKAPTVVRQRAPEFRSFYANYAQLGYTAYDISMLLGEVVEASKEKVILEERARVSLSPLEAKVLERVIGNVLRQYEAKFGPISVPPGVIPDAVG